MNTNAASSENEDFEQAPESGEIAASSDDMEIASTGEKRSHKGLPREEIRAAFDEHDAIQKKLGVLYTQVRELEAQRSVVVEKIYFGAARGKRWIRNGIAWTASKRGASYFFKQQAQEDVEQI